MTKTRKLIILGVLPCVLVGCATTGDGKSSGIGSRLKTIASVGDRPVRTVSGEPGRKLATAEPLDPEPRRETALSRISGRVTDPDGVPVPNVAVRVADGGVSKGRLVGAVTDASGGFTLRGLRPDTRYTLIAETEGEDGRVLIGRAGVHSSDSGVRIKLSDDQAVLASGTRTLAVSRGRPRALIENEDQSTAPLFNEEDVPAASSRSRPADSRVWKSKAPADPAARRASRSRIDDGSEADAQLETALPEASTSDDPDDLDPLPPAIEQSEQGDDEVNPLPPAIEPEEEVERRPITRPRPLLDQNPLPPAIESGGDLKPEKRSVSRLRSIDSHETEQGSGSAQDRETGGDRIAETVIPAPSAETVARSKRSPTWGDVAGAWSDRAKVERK